MFDRLFRRAPSTFTLQINGPETTLTAQAKESILLAALHHGVALPYNCRVGGCGECKCRLISGKVKELTDKSYLLSAEELQQNYILACQSLPRSDVVIEVALRQDQPSHPIVETEARITQLTPLTHDIVHLRVALAQPMTYTTGQYADLIVPAEAGPAGGQTRSYSFASAPAAHANDQADFFIRKVPGGAFTTWLFTHGRVGQHLHLRGPYGDFSLHAHAGPVVCIAGGSGLAPIKAILEQAVEAGRADQPLLIILGARTQQDLYGADMVAWLQRQWRGPLQFEPILSEEPADSDWHGRRGWISDHLRALLGETASQHQAYLCGPPAMIDTCIDHLAQAGVPSSSVFFDKFLDSGHAPAT